MDTQDEEKSSPTKEIERLQALVREKDERLDKLKEASMRDPRCSQCHYPVAESRRRLCITCSNHVNVDSGGTVTIKDFEEAENMLMCGSCVMDDSTHAGHCTRPYLQLKTRQHLSERLSDLEQEFDKDNWRNIFISSAEYVPAIAERLRQLENRQFRTWTEFQKLWNAFNLLLWRAQTHHRNIKQAIDDYGRDMRDILRTLDVLVNSHRTEENATGFAPDRVLRDQCEISGEAADKPTASIVLENANNDLNTTVREHGDVKTWMGFRWSSEVAGNTPPKTPVKVSQQKPSPASEQDVNICDDDIVCEGAFSRPSSSRQWPAPKQKRSQIVLSLEPTSTTPLSAFEPVEAKRSRTEVADLTRLATGNTAPQIGVTTARLSSHTKLPNAEFEMSRASNIMAPVLENAQMSVVCTAPVNSPSLGTLGATGTTVPVWTTPITPDHLVVARNALLTPPCDMRSPLFDRVWSAASALTRTILQPSSSPCPPAAFAAVNPPVNIPTVGEALPSAVQPKMVGKRRSSSSGSQSLPKTKLSATKKRGSKVPALVEGPTSLPLAATAGDNEAGDGVHVIVGKPLTMSSLMNTEPAAADAATSVPEKSEFSRSLRRPSC